MDPLTLSWLHSLNLLPDDERCHHGSDLAHTRHPGVKKSSESPHPHRPSTLFHFPNLEVQICYLLLPSSLCSSALSDPPGGAIMLWPGAQQQPSGNGLRLLRELPVHFAIDYRGWTPTSPPSLPPHPHPLHPVPPHSSLLTLSQNDSSLDCRAASL